MPAPSGQESITAPAVATDLTRQELPYRLRQQSLLGEFGRLALQTRDIAQILQRATELRAQGLETPFAKVLEYLPEDKRLLVCAGVGWESEVIGKVSLGVDLESPAGYAFQTGQVVISNHLQEETRFRTPKLLSDHGIRRAINVLIARGGEEGTRPSARRRTLYLIDGSVLNVPENRVVRVSKQDAVAFGHRGWQRLSVV
jgi:two-component system, sensor histidine kinase PdtaS